MRRVGTILSRLTSGLPHEVGFMILLTVLRVDYLLGCSLRVRLFR